MDLLNDLIVLIDEAGLRENAYGTINTVALIIALLLGLVNGLKLKTRLIATLVTLLAYYALSGPITTAVVFVEDGFTVTGRQNGVYFFAFVPLIGFLLSLALKKSYKQLWDVLMVIPLARFVLARIACTVTGCCRGYPFEWGVYNPVVGEKLFPIQLLEAFFSLLILAYVLWREKKNKFVSDGRNVPIILISYGISRFFLEFLHNDEKLMLGKIGFNLMQFHCILMIIVGIITLRIIQKSEKQYVDAVNEESVPQ